MTDSLSSHIPEPRRIMRHAKPANRTGWMRWLPGLDNLRRYKLSWLRYDIVAGLVMTTMLVPVGIAYAEASGVPGINGLYATIAALLAYALFGPSRILVLGPDSALASMILTIVLPLSGGDPQRAVALAGMMAVVCGVVCIAAGLARLGFITELLSKPIRYGYMNGIALTVLLSQIPKLFGFSVTENGSLRQAWGIVHKLLAGNTNVVALAIGAGTLALILLLKRLAARPGHYDRGGRGYSCSRGLPPPNTCWRVSTRSLCRRDCLDRAFPLSALTTWSRSSRVASLSPWFHSRTRACFLEAMRRVCIPRSIRTRR